MSVKWMLISLCFFVFLMGAVGCEDKDILKNGWKALAVSSTTYDSVMTACGNLYKKGKISDEKKELIVSIGKVYTGSYFTAIKTMENYEKVISEGKSSEEVSAAKKAFKVAVTTLKADLFDLIDNYNLIVDGIDGIAKIEKPEAVNVN